jgi:hypothetical protein
MMIYIRIISLAFLVTLPAVTYSDDNKLIDIPLLVGKKNRKPVSPEAALESDEFIVYSKDERTIRVNRNSDFPQIIRSNQRIAVFFKQQKKKKNLLFKANVIISKKHLNASNSTISVSINKNIIYKQSLKDSDSSIKAIIPYSFLTSDTNVLEIINHSKFKMAFDCCSLVRYSEEQKITETFPKDDEFKKTLGTKVEEYTGYGKNFERKLPLKITGMVIDRINLTEKIFSLSELVKHPGLYDPSTGSPVTAFKAIDAFTPLFEGNPKLITCNVVPLAEDSSLNSTKWVAVNNTEGVYTIILSSSHDKGKDVKLNLPFPGKKFDKIKCLLKDDYDSKFVNIKDYRINDDNIAIDFELKEIVILRVISDDVKLPKKISFLAKNLKIVPKTLNGNRIMKISYTDPSPTALRTPIRWPNGYRGITGKPYAAEETSSTAEKIGKITNVVPWNSKSEVVKIIFTGNDGKGGVSFYLGKGPHNADILSFWVLPRSKMRTRTIHLPFSFKSEGETFLFNANLKPDIWQRIMISLKDVKAPYYGNIRFWGDSKSSEYRNGNMVSVELNGFSVLTHPDKSFSYRIISKKDSKSYKSMNVIFLGEPGKTANFRHRFTKPVKIKKTELKPSLSDSKIIYHDEAQIFETQFKFPNIGNDLSEEVLKSLNANERKKVKNGLVPVNLLIEVDK